MQIPHDSVDLAELGCYHTHTMSDIPPVPKSRLAYILLAFFLGGLGIHNFYAGYTGKGIAQLLLVLLTGWLVIPAIAVLIWILVEICTVTKDAKGVPFVS